MPKTPEKREGPATQPTQPKKGEPVEIPVPDRETVLADLKKLGGVKPRSQQD